MKIQGKSRDFEVVICRHFWPRLKGNMGKKVIENVLLFPHCNSIHTFFMRTKIDVVMISSQGEVLHTFSQVPAYRILWPRKKVKATLEFPSGENSFQVGDYLSNQKEV